MGCPSNSMRNNLVPFYLMGKFKLRFHVSTLFPELLIHVISLITNSCHRYTAEILPIRRKTLFIQSVLLQEFRQSLLNC